jgi:hypothetical protein
VYHIPTGTQIVSSIFILSSEIEKTLGLSLHNYEWERIHGGRKSLKFSAEFIVSILKGSGFEANIRPRNELQTMKTFTYTPASSLVLQSDFGKGKCGFIKSSHHDNTFM